MRKTLIVVLIIVLSILIACPLAGFWYVNNVLLPKKIKPQLIIQASAQLHQKVSIDNIYLTPAGSINVRKISVKDPLTAADFLSIESFSLKPDYKKLFSQRKLKEITLPFAASISNIEIVSQGIKCLGNLNIKAVVKFNMLKRTIDDYQGNINIAGFSVNNIPSVNAIKNINGKISFDKQKIASGDITGYVAGIVPLNIEFIVDDYLNDPSMTLSAAVLGFSAQIAAQKKQNDIFIKKCEAKLGGILLEISGAVKNIASPQLDLMLKLALPLSDIKKSPFFLSQLKNINLAGTITAVANIRGEVKTPENLEASFLVSSPDSLQVDKIMLSGIKVHGFYKDKAVNLDAIEANIFDAKLSGTAAINLALKDLPYQAALKLQGLEVAKLTQLGLPVAELNALADSEIEINGFAAELNNCAASVLLNINKISYQNQLYAPISAAAAVVLKKDAVDIKSLDIKCNDIVLNMLGNVKGLNLRLDAVLKGSLSFSLDNLAAIMPPELQSSVANLKPNGKINADFTLAGPLKEQNKLKFNIQINSDEIKILQYQINDLKLAAKLENQVLTLSDIVCRLYQGELKAALIVDLNSKNLPVEGNISLKDVLLKDVQAATAIDMQGLSGKLSATVGFNGQCMPEPIISSSLALSLNEPDLNGTALLLFSLEGMINFKAPDLKIKAITLKSGNMSIAASGDIINLFDPKAALAVKFGIPLDYASIIYAGYMRQPLPVSLNGLLNGDVKLNGPIKNLQAIEFKSSLNSSEISINQFAISEFKSDITMQQGIVNVGLVDFNIYSGKASARFLADLTNKNIPYELTAQLDRLNLGQMMQEARMPNQNIQGILAANLSVAGAGPDVNTISGNAAFKLTDAKLYNVGLLTTIGSILGLNWLNRFDVNVGWGNFIISGGVAKTEDLTLQGEDVKINANGEIGLNQQLNLMANINLSQALSAQSKSTVLGDFLVSDDGSLLTQIAITGTVSKPIIKPVISEKKIENVIGNTLKNILLQKFAPAGTPAQ